MFLIWGLVFVIEVFFEELNYFEKLFGFEFGKIDSMFVWLG